LGSFGAGELLAFSSWPLAREAGQGLVREDGC